MARFESGHVKSTTEVTAFTEKPRMASMVSVRSVVRVKLIDSIRLTRRHAAFSVRLA